MTINIMKKYLRIITIVVAMLISANVFAETNEINYTATLQKRLESEEKLAQNTKILYAKMEMEINKILQNIQVEHAYQISSKNNIYDQLKLQSTKVNLQSQKLRTDRDAIQQEIIGNENAIFQLESQLQGILGPGKQEISANDTSINAKIKELQKLVSYNKVILDINSKRLKVLNSYYDAVTKLQQVQEDALSKLQRVTDEYNKQHSINILNAQEIAIGKKIDDLLALELQYRNEIQDLDVVRLDSKVDSVKYNRLYNQIIDVVSKRGLLETELSFFRFNSRLEEMNILFSDKNTEVIKKKNLTEKLDRLRKEANAINNLIVSKINFIKEYTLFVNKDKQLDNINQIAHAKTIILLEEYNKKYTEYFNSINKSISILSEYSNRLKALYLKDISIRQSLPDGWAELQELVQDFINIPYLLSKQILVSWLKFSSYFTDNPGLMILELALLEVLILLLIGLFFKLIHIFSARFYTGKAERFSNLTFYILSTFLRRNRYTIAILFNLFTVCWFTNTNGTFINILGWLSLLYLLIKFVLNLCYIFLIENTMEISGDDSRLFRGLRYSLIFGGALYALTILGASLNLSINTLGFIDRLFMLFLLAISYPLIINWQVVPQLIVDGLKPKPYLRKAIWLLGIIVPVTILSNAALGIIGYVNLAWRIAVAEFQLSLIITLWLVSKGVLSELMDITSIFFIRNVTNGWLWTESVLKPLNTVINFILLLIAIFGLIVIYGLNNNIEYFEFIDKTLNYKLFVMQGENADDHADIYVKSFLVFCIIFAFVIWATKWSREFAYRWLYSKVKDLAVRNSLSVFTQYTTLVIGVLVILKVLQVPTTSLMVTIGGLLFFLGFGLRDIISNYISGIILLIERQVRAGDFITVGEFEGKVTKIGMRSITVEAFDNMEVIVPNTDTITKPLINWTYKDSIIRLNFNIRISYEEDLEYIRSLLLEVFKGIDDVLSEPHPNVFFKELSDSAIVAVVYYYIDLIKTPSRAAVRTTVMMAIMKTLEINKIRIAYPKQKIDLEEKIIKEPSIETGLS